MLSDDEVPEPEGELMLVLKERVQRIIMWLNQNFLLTEVANHLKKLDKVILKLKISIPDILLYPSSLVSEHKWWNYPCFLFVKNFKNYNFQLWFFLLE